jgi:uncharacterized membrane protein YdjX (TVP38/TMEM64 family)
MDFFQDLSNLSVSMVTTYIKTFGILAPAVAFLLFAVQAALPVFPYIVLAAAGGILFGFKLGFLLSWLGALVGACVAYWLCRLAAGEWAIRQIKNRFGYDPRAVSSEAAFWTIVIARIIPVIPTPLINAAAALGGVSFWNFFFSSALGKIPSAVLYTGLGVCLFKTRDIKLTLVVIAAILVLAVAGRYYSKRSGWQLRARTSVSADEEA